MGIDIANAIAGPTFAELYDDDTLGALYVDQPTNEDDPTMYSIFRYTWAFKSFRVTAIRYFDRFNRYPRVAAWSKKKGRFLAEMVIPFFEGNIHAARLTPDDNEARSDWTNLQTTIETQHDVDGIVVQNIPNREKMQQLPSKYLVTPFTAQPPTTMVPKQRVSKTKNKGKKANLSPLNLGGVLEGYNEEDNNVTFLGSQFTGNILFYQNVDPAKVIANLVYK
uniref:Uncharacterized protein n=1 Tax=Tanacetum cinerariifolium TaxID=118510 RepID=A0A6L2MMH3_TANCI|nr:hypothetical protein [Tanacetum cinerariifolium]